MSSTRIAPSRALSIRYAESEPHDKHALLLSPWPERIYCDEPTWMPPRFFLM